MTNPKHPVPGDMSIDATDVDLVYLTPAQIKRLSKTRTGFEKALTCLSSLTAEQAKVLGISESDRTEAHNLTAGIARIDELLPAAEEMVQRLHHADLARGHRAATLVHGAAAAARARADHDPAAAQILGALEDLVEYTSEVAERSAATRAKNAKKASANGAAANGANGANGTTPA